MADLPRFKSPPVVEVALSLQFAEISQLTAAHVGWFWKERLGPDNWVKANQTDPIADAHETFGRPNWSFDKSVRIASVRPRLQFTTPDEERMIQVQSTRFVYNWRQRGGEYPKFEKLLPAFEDKYQDFCAFLEDRGLGAPDVKLWELVYIDQIPRGRLWRDPSDWKNISASLAAPTSLEGQQLETFNGEWHFGLEDSKGRLRVQIQHVKVGGPDGEEAIQFRSIARGPVIDDFRKGFNLGHEHAVKSFVAITTEEAKRAWERGE